MFVLFQSISSLWTLTIAIIEGNGKKARTGNAIEDVGGGFSLWKAIEEPSEALASFLDDVHALLDLKIAEILLPNAALFPDPNHALSGEGATNLPERGSGAGVGGDVEVHPPIGGTLAGDDVADAVTGVACLGNALRRELDLGVGDGVVCGGLQVPLRLPVTHQNYSLG